jgi:hypothetical protein
MKSPYLALLLTITPAGIGWAETVAPAPNGIARPDGYQKWRLVGVSQRTENGTLRAILGNDTAIEAAKAGKTNPWPDGTILTKPSWKHVNHDLFPAAVVPAELVHVDFMIKDSAKYAATGGWGFARWLGDKAVPYGANADFVRECFACHGAAKDTDWVFTRPVKLP